MYFTRGRDLREQYAAEYQTMARLLEYFIEGREIAPFFRFWGIRRAAIVPNNLLGQALASLLKGSEIEISFPVPSACVDRAVDVVVIADIYDRSEIIDTLLASGVPLEKILGINTVLFGLEEVTGI